MVERRDQLHGAGAQHAVAEHVAGHVAHAGGGEFLGLRVDAELGEVALDGLPGAAGGDAHGLVVVADRAAGGEGVAQPVPAFLGDRVGDVGEGRGALVRGDHQVGVVAVQAHDVCRRHHGLAVGVGDQVVGDLQQRADEDAVGGLALFHPGAAVDGRVRQLLGEEAALGAGRHDHGVLDHLRLDQAQDLGAEVVAAVRPAQAATGDLAEAQVHALDARGADPDLVLGARERRTVDLARHQLEGQRRGIGVVVGAQRRLDDVHEAAQQLVGIQRRDLFQRLGQRGVCGLAGGGGFLGGQRRVEGALEERDDAVGDVRVCHQGVGNERVGVRDAQLVQVLGVGAQQRDLAPAHGLAQHQAVEVVGLGDAGHDRAVGGLEQRLGGQRVDPLRELQAQVVEVAFLGAQRG